jgi:hypothetical protein
MNPFLLVDQTQADEAIVLAWGAGLLGGTVACAIESGLESANRWRKQEVSSWSRAIAHKAPVTAAIYAVMASGFVLTESSNLPGALSTAPEDVTQAALQLLAMMIFVLPVFNFLMGIFFEFLGVDLSPKNQPNVPKNHYLDSK